MSHEAKLNQELTDTELLPTVVLEYKGIKTNSQWDPDGKCYFEVRYNSGQVDGYPQIGYSKSGGINAGEMVGFHTPSGSNYRAKIAGTVVSNAFSGGISSNDIL